MYITQQLYSIEHRRNLHKSTALQYCIELRTPVVYCTVLYTSLCTALQYETVIYSTVVSCTVYISNVR